MNRWQMNDLRKYVYLGRIVVGFTKCNWTIVSLTTDFFCHRPSRCATALVLFIRICSATRSFYNRSFFVLFVCVVCWYFMCIYFRSEFIVDQSSQTSSSGVIKTVHVIVNMFRRPWFIIIHASISNCMYFGSSSFFNMRLIERNHTIHW